MTDRDARLGLAFPLRITASAESVRVVDRLGRTAAYVYVCDDAERRQQTRRVTTAQGVEIAKVIARALTDESLGSQPS